MLWQRLKLVLFFYRQFLIASLVVDLTLVYLDIALIVALMGKILLAGLVYWFYSEGKRKYEFDFYRNLGIGAIQLFLWAVIIDAFLLFVVYLIF